ncbi:MAG: tetratricopeptide repeat protein, partial [Alphaproteobacteria bacterium]|nr:tetratricopeptide repeat protein [Alphaproteobacteria bacterium]
IIMPYLVMKSNEKLEGRVKEDIDDNINKIKGKYEDKFKEFYEEKKDEFSRIVEEAKNAIDECHKVVESYRQISDVKQMGNDKVNNNENPYGKKNIIENQNNKVETNIKEVSQNRSALNKFFEKAKLFHEAGELSGKGLYNEAIDKYRNALKLYGKDNEILHNIGYCYYKQKKYSEALEYFNKALAIKENVLTLHGIAVIYFCEKKYKKALEYCDKVLNLSPDLRECLNNKYLIYMKLEEYKKALEVMKKITDTYPVDIGDYYNLTEAYIFNDKFMEAIISLNTYYKNQINPFIYSDDFEEWKAKIEKSNSPQKDELLNLLNKLSLRQREDYV